MRKYVLFLIIACWAMLSPMAQAQDACKPVGWATVGSGVTGGGSATPTVVKNYTDFKAALQSKTVAVIHVSGTITIPAAGRVNIKDLSNKTIFGLPGSKIVSTDMTKTGSGIFYMTRCVNFIIRNLVFEGPGAYDTDGYDNLCIDNCQRMWFDHCEFHDGMDGNFDIKNMSDFISVTWCTFSYEKPPKAGGSGGSADHRYTNLIGSSDGATNDENKLRVTFQYCWWGEGCRERMPRIRYGKIHLANNLFSSSVANNCIRAGFKADILAEGNYFDKQKLPIDEFDKNYTAIKAVNNYGAADMTKGTAFKPEYTLDISMAADIVAPIKACAGAKLTSQTGCSSCTGTAVNKLPTVSLTAPANKADFVLGSAVTLSATAVDQDGDIVSVIFYHAGTILSTDNSSPYSYSWTPPSAGSYVISATATDNSGATTVSDAVTITVTDRTKPSLVSTDNLNQSVQPGTAIASMIFTWGDAATGVSYTALPDGLKAVTDNAKKTLTVTGKPTTNGNFTVSTKGGTAPVNLVASVTISKDGILADWYPFQEAAVSLRFVSFTDASVVTDAYDQTKPDNGVAYTPGALRLTKETGTLIISLESLSILKIRVYATGNRTLEVTYGPTGKEHTWNSPTFASGASELNLTALISDLATNEAVIVNINNNRIDGGSYNIHDLYVEGYAGEAPVEISQSIDLSKGWNMISFYTNPQNADIASLFAGLDVRQIKNQTSFWDIANPAHLNSLESMSSGVGYLVNMNTAGKLTVTGMPIAEGLATLSSGWNLSASPAQHPAPLADYINAATWQAVKDFNAYWLPGRTDNALETFEPGKAYFILVK